MTIFMSWSGEKSRTFAACFKPWLEQVLAGTDVWLSSEDLDKGTIWFTEIIRKLEQCHGGVILLTRENHLAPWIHFEAGGMIKGLGKSHVATVLLDIDYAELQQPLNQFNGLRINQEGAWHLVQSFNRLSDRPIRDNVLLRMFDKFWPELDNDYKMLFPDSHKLAQQASPALYFPSAPIVGRTAKPKQSKKQVAPEPGLFNGVE